MTTNNQYIPIFNRSQVLKLYLDEIESIVKDGRKITFHTNEGEFSTYIKIEDIIGYLNENFYRCNTRCIINLAKVDKMFENTIFFNDGYTMTLCRQKFSKAIQAYKGYLIRITGQNTNETK